MSATADFGSHIALFVVENAGKYHVDLAHWDELDAAYHHWIERRIDRVLSLNCTDGGPLLIAASRIAEVTTSTPETRARSRELEEAYKAETGYKGRRMKGTYCKLTGKLDYSDPKQAEKRRKAIRRRRDERLNVYRCKCGKWHLGH